MPLGACLSTRMKRTIFQYRTGTLYNQKHAVRFKRSTSLTCPFLDCHHMDSGLHILSGCQCPVMRNMVTERHNIACRMILKEISEGSYGANLVQVMQETLTVWLNITCTSLSMSLTVSYPPISSSKTS